jgi:GNAT superfamily N-acetyltransferase
MVMNVEPLTADRWPALTELFGRSGASNGCWCMYWLLGPDYHRRPRDQNEQALRDAATTGPSPGLLAMDDGVAVGWCRLTPRAELAWLDHFSFLAPVDDIAVWSLPCFYIRRAHRHRGVAAALIEAAVATARTAGVPAVEGYPIDTRRPGHTTNLFPGTVSTFERAGFRVVARRRPDRPVMRYDLRGHN